MKRGSSMNKTLINEKGQYYTHVGKYKVVQEGKRFCGIYDCWNVMVTSRSSWRQAIKTAKLLDNAYKEGVENTKDNLF